MNVEHIERRFEYGLATNSILAGAMTVGRPAGLSEVDTLKLAAVELADHSARMMAIIEAQSRPAAVSTNNDGCGPV